MPSWRYSNQGPHDINTFNNYRSIVPASEIENRPIYPMEYCPIGFHRLV